jgi:hypothetical protein
LIKERNKVMGSGLDMKTRRRIIILVLTFGAFWLGDLLMEQYLKKGFPSEGLATFLGICRITLALSCFLVFTITVRSILKDNSKF